MKASINISTVGHAKEPAARNFSPDRRCEKRVPLSCQVQFLYSGKVGNQQSEDISEGGLRLQGAFQAPLREHLKLFVPMPQVARAICFPMSFGRKGGLAIDAACGVQFIDPPIESLVKLRTYIRKI